MKKFLSAITAMLMSVSCLQLFPVGAVEENLVEGYATGSIWVSAEEFAAKTGTQVIDTSTQIMRTALPSQFDITDKTASHGLGKYFPPIGNQGSIPSCTSWATTYYQFTYEVNRFKNETTTQNNIYSPTWTYNYTNGGVLGGTSFENAYNVLKHQGAMKLADLPYTGNPSNFSLDWPTNKQKMIDALEYRATATSYTVTNQNSINTIKQKISSGNVATVWTSSVGWLMRRNADDEDVIIRGGFVDLNNDGNIDSGHAMTVVGYDDNLQITYNGVTFTGAFKLANSWGDTWSKDGYVWVAYDALLSTSAYGESWQSECQYSRIPIFGTGNTFRFITVYERDVAFVSWIQFISDDAWHNKFYVSKSITGLGTHGSKRWENSLGNVATTSGRRYLAFDYFEPTVSYNLNSYITTGLAVKVTGTSTSSTVVNSKVLDNLGNVVATNGNNYTAMSNGEFITTHSISLAKGRVTAYDNAQITSADSELVLNHLVENVALSNLQLFLADYNSDGTVNINDVIAMNQYISSLSGQSYQLTDYIDEWGCSLADVIEEEYNMPIEQYISENYTELSAMNVIPEDLGGDLYAY